MEKNKKIKRENNKELKIMQNLNQRSWNSALFLMMFLMLNFAAANSFTISQSNPLIEGISDNSKDFDLNYLVDSGINLLIGFISINEIGTVSAQTPAMYCCAETNGGAICQNTPSDTPSNDSNGCENPIPAECDLVSDCKRGCCIDETEGLCSTNSPRGVCEISGGAWSDDESCLIDECQKGCCVLGDNVQFATDNRCTKLSLEHGFEKDFRPDITSEIECLVLSENLEQGACVIDQSNCWFGTVAMCANLSGEFYENYLCSHPDLETACERQTSTGCIEGKDEIYWLDSCNNKENIYSSDRPDSWNNGMVLRKSESCNPDDANIDSENCGNCDYLRGSLCADSTDPKIIDGDNICKSLNCGSAPGHAGEIKDRKNGESWCVYDSYIGDGKDPAGSRHWKRYCIDGEVEVEPCADYRGQICVQSQIEDPATSEIFSAAFCAINEAPECLSYNPLQETSEEVEGLITIHQDNVDKCLNNKDCMIKSVNVDEGFQFNVCVARYPKGFAKDQTEENIALCGMATQTCVMRFEKDYRGRYDCIYNCNCMETEFVSQMHDLCSSLGDCGSYINYIGDGTDNSGVNVFAVIPGVEDYNNLFYSWTNYINYAAPVAGQHAIPKDTREILGAIALSGASPEEKEDLQSRIEDDDLEWVILLSGAGVGLINALTGEYIAGYLGISGDGSDAMSLSIMSGNLFAALIIYLTGWGTTKDIDVQYICNPWQAPTGGSNCERCNEDPLRPCTRYRCESLGQACVILNEEEENAVCQSIVYESRAPLISPKEVLTENYEFADEEERMVRLENLNREDGCIQEFATVDFVLETDEFAQCKYDFEQVSTYENMSNYPKEATSYVIDHIFEIMMPSLDSLYIYNLSGDLRSMYGNMNMFVRCQDYHGNFNNEEYAVNFCVNDGPDLTAPAIQAAEPESESYIAFNATESEVAIYINEPVDCRYSAIPGIDYDLMENNFTFCNQDVLNGNGPLGWPCMTTLTGLTNGTNIFYFKCKDQPWISYPDYSGNRTEEDRNTNAEDYSYILYSTEYRLIIDSASPSDVLVRGAEPVSVDLELTTSGGAEDGVAVCEYEWGENNWVEFLESSDTVHVQPGLNLPGGSYNISVRCEDIAGNIDYSNLSFEVQVDTTPPSVIENSTNGYQLSLTTDEDAECYYNSTSCSFNFEDGISMTAGFSASHSTAWNPAVTYYIKCADIWGHVNENNTGCTTVINRPDSGLPTVVRAYKSGNQLIVLTDRESKCYHNSTDCSFDLNSEAISMTTGGFSASHSTAWNSGQIYYIKCENAWGDVGDDCSIIVSA